MDRSKRIFTLVRLTDLFRKIERFCDRGNVWEHEKPVEGYRQGDDTIDDETIGWLLVCHGEEEKLRMAISNRFVRQCRQDACKNVGTVFIRLKEAYW